jgi:hypothetical protein
MGIPIGWNISREEAKEKDILRADVTGQRSPIRRRIRLARSPRSQSASHEHTDMSTSRFAPHPESISRSSHGRTRLPPPPAPEAAYRSNEALREPPSLQREDASFRRSRSPRDDHMRAYETRRGVDSYRPTYHPLPAFTPGFAPATASRTAGEDIIREAQEISQGGHRSPYRRLPDPRLTRSRSPRADQSAFRRGESADSHDGHESSDSNAVGFPPLRRMGRRTIADGPLPASSLRESWSPASTVDGLGDRERSLSPFDEQMHWDNFLTTVVPDPVAPTAESSFASAAASASFSNSHQSSRAGSSNASASSSLTHLTVPSQRNSPPSNDQFMRACDTSDDDTASDTEVEDDDEAAIAEAMRHRRDHVTFRRRIRPSYFADEPPRRDTERYSQQVHERSRHAANYVQSFWDARERLGMTNTVSGLRRASRTREYLVDGPLIEQLDGTADGQVSASDEDVPPLVSISSPPLDQELRDARSLLERLSRREDVSDDFWASVGLTRSMADRVESFDERERL